MTQTFKVGVIIAALAFTEPNGRWDSTGVETTAVPVGGRFRLDGVKSFVVDGHSADLIVVLARRPGSVGDEGLSFFTVSGDASGLTRRALKVMDPWTRRVWSYIKYGYSIKEIARRLDLTEFQVEFRYRRRLARLRNYFRRRDGTAA